jgi:hypothetical protein
MTALPTIIIIITTTTTITTRIDVIVLEFGVYRVKIRLMAEKRFGRSCSC